MHEGEGERCYQQTCGNKCSVSIHHALTRHLTAELAYAQHLEGSREEVDIDLVHAKLIMN